MADDFFDYKLAVNPATGSTVPGAQADVYDVADTSFTSPLAITDMQGIPLAHLIAGPTGVYPPFKVTSGKQRVLAVSGSMVTPLTSDFGSRGDPGLPGAPGIGLPDAASTPNGYIPVTQGGQWAITPLPSGGGTGGAGDELAVYYSGGSYPAQPTTAPAGVKRRHFYGPTPYTGATWAGVIDLYDRVDGLT